MCALIKYTHFKNIKFPLQVDKASDMQSRPVTLSTNTSNTKTHGSVRTDCKVQTAVSLLRDVIERSHEISCLLFKNPVNEDQFLGRCLDARSTVAAAAGSRDRLATSLREPNNGDDAKRRDASATDLRSICILQHEHQDQTVDYIRIKFTG